MEIGETKLVIATEIGTFGSLDMRDPTIHSVEEFSNKVKDPHLKKYLEEQTKNMNGGNDNGK